MFQAGHPDDVVLESYCMKELEGHPLDVFEEHLLVCAQCQDRVTDTDSFLRGMRSALVAPLHAVSASGWDLRRLFQIPVPVWAIAAVALAGIVGAIAVHELNPEAAPLAIALSATRGGSMPTAKSGIALDLDLDTRDLSPVAGNRVQIVNADGNEVWSGAATSVQNGHTHAIIKSPLSAGQYYVRIADPAGTHREYALRLGN